MKRPPTLRLAIAQLRMHWTLDENLASVLAAMRLARAEGAGICTLPELALPGFHRRIAQESQPERIDTALMQVRALAAELGLAAAIGAPRFESATPNAQAEGEAARFNSHWLIDERGDIVAVIDKNGITPAEATFFAAGLTRPAGKLAGIDCSAVICREIEDHDTVLGQLRALPRPPQLLFWPGQMRPNPDKPEQGDPPEHVRQAQDLARAANAWVVQANWPNALYRPEESPGCGRSAVIAPDGELLFRLPEQGEGIAVFDWGERGEPGTHSARKFARTYTWHPASTSATALPATATGSGTR